MPRPKGSQNKIAKDQKQFIVELLRDNQDKFREYFSGMTQSCNVVIRQQFLQLYHELQKLVIPKPQEISIKQDSEEFSQMMSLFNKWGSSEEDDDKHSDVDGEDDDTVTHT